MTTGPILRRGATGDAVKELQDFLAAAGFKVGPSDGVFGKKTEKALIAYQRQKGLSADGIAGPETWDSIKPAAKAAPDAEATALIDEVEALVRTQYPTMAWALDHPDLGPLLREAAEQKWDPVKLQGELQATTWWQETSASARSFAIMKETDPAEYQRNFDEAQSRVVSMMRQLGVDITPESIQGLVEDTLTLGLTQEQMRIAILSGAGAIDLGALEAGEVGGLVASSKQQIEQISRSYLLGLDDESMKSWINKITAGTHTLDSFTEYAQGMAKAQLPFLSTFIDQGIAPEEALAPYRSAVAQTLEILPGQVDFMDPRYQSVLRVQEGDTQRLATTSEMKQNTRKVFQNEWQKTSGAKQVATQLSQQIAETFGRRA